MSKGIRLALVMNLLSLLFSGVLVHSGQSTVPLKSFKIGENVTYDCIDIHLQPGLDHPLLKYHRIQMNPSISRPELKSQIGINKVQKQKIPCPDGTIPVWRNKKECTTNAQVLAENHVHSLSPDSPGTHLAGVRSQNGPFRGVEAWFKMFKLDIANDQASYGQIYIGSGSNTEVNFISAGWMINPSFFGDSRTWTYGFWKGKDGKGCYNTACSGFVQVSQTFPIVQPIDFPAGQSLWLHYSIHEDKNTGNWWLTELGSGEPNIDIGYWPKELFNLLDNGANMVGAGGVVQASSSGSSPEMGNGRFPNADHPRDSGIFTNVEVMDSNYVQHKMNYFPTEVVLDSPKCYRLTIGKTFIFRPNRLGFYFRSGRKLLWNTNRLASQYLNSQTSTVVVQRPAFNSARRKVELPFPSLQFLNGVVVHSGQSTVPLKSFKIGENVTYDCIDIYMQSGLDHPLLKYHTIQMKPSVSRTELKSQIGINKVQKQKIPCPDGTIPVWRNTKEFTTNTQVLAENHVHFLSPDSPGTHLAGVRSLNGPYHGVEAWFKMFELDIAKDQASYSQIYIGNGSNNEVNFISAGWMINPSFFGDGRTWTYGFWKGKDGKGCYNTACSGFVQVSQTVPIVQPIDVPTGQFLWLHYSIHQDKNTGNWWITELGEPNIDIGYWPKELFNLLDNGAIMVGAGGVVQASRSGSSPEMGNGQFPNVNHPNDSAIFTNIEVLDSNYVQRKMNYFPTEVLLDSPKCYGLTIEALGLGEPGVDLGYWPKELFNLLDNGANMVGAGGVVQASRSGSSPEMGNGQFPNVNHPENSALLTNIEVLDSSYEQHKMNYVPTEVVLDSPKCYGLTIGKRFIFRRNRYGFYLNYGGPGGNSCGV
ncbi:hypothetical protein IGI04_008390 [Brassica rapa subsp. trilocularis]|uniref:Neprosin PEP catalytic domain-containing protein n=1 Tax=Brassica rapa subsp. trilocularis TaxID=1813537 RepID=A0ABQ7NPK5_BRACM|nr:hypothetical protein IGI04_008390 [Brassica rapa subsp. trilocularis]